jgi:membrane-associated phospholipid phosphatase
MFDALNNFLHYIGYLGPNLLLITTIILLINKTTLTIIYVLGFSFNIILNFLLKGIIQQPRPSEDKHLFNAMINAGKRIGPDKYGMPSGHAQSVFYSLAFVHFSIKNNYITFLYLLLCLNTMYQRVLFQNHTIEQVIVGAFFGIAVGALFYFQATKLLLGDLKSKQDDNGPI